MVSPISRTTDQDYAEWAQRMVDFSDEPEITGQLAYTDNVAWQDFVGRTFRQMTGKELTGSQRNALNRGARLQFEFLPINLSATFDTTIRVGTGRGGYRDTRPGLTRGRFISPSIIRETSALQERGITFERSGSLGRSVLTSQGRFRGAGGRFISSLDAAFNLELAGLR